MTPQQLSPWHGPHVSTTVRVYIALAGFLGVWQFGWIADQADRLHAKIPEPWTVTFWLATWAAVAVTSITAAITGKDAPTRVALTFLASASAMGIATALASPQPMGELSWPVGQAVVLTITSFVLLLGPLRDRPLGGCPDD